MKSVFASDKTEIFYDTWGTNRDDAIVLIQGLGMDSRGYGLQRFMLSQDHFCIAIDHRGSGLTRVGKEFSLYRLTRDVLRIMEAENISSAHLVGSSMGGIVAQILGVVYPHHVKSLTLISTSCSQHEWRTELLHEWKSRLTSRRSQVLDRDILSWLIGPRLLHRSTVFLPIAQQLFHEIDIDEFCLQIDAVTSFSDSFADNLSSITAPTHVIVGSQDMLTPVGDSQEICMHIPNARLSIIYGAAHGVVIESPIHVGRYILNGIEHAKKVASDVSV